MRNQKVKVVEQYRLRPGEWWSKVQLSKGQSAYIKTADLADKPRDAATEEISPPDLFKVLLERICPDVSITSDVMKSDYTLDGTKDEKNNFNFTVFYRDGKT